MTPCAGDKVSLERALSVYSRGVCREVYKARLEQYPTPTSLAAHIAWTARMKNTVTGKTIADFGCGSGVLAVASIIAGSRRAVCIDVDEEMVRCTQRVVSYDYPWALHKLIPVVSDATTIELANIDTVLMNPPFGVVKHNRGLDMKFLESALKNAKNVFSLHKYSEGFLRKLEKLKEATGFRVMWLEKVDLGIPMIYQRHRRKIYRVKVLFIGITKE